MRCIKLACFLAGIGRKLLQEILIDKAEHIVVLPAVHRNLVNQMNQIARRLTLHLRIFAELRESHFERLENPLKDFFMRRRNQAVKRRERHAHIVNRKIHALPNPGRE